MSAIPGFARSLRCPSNWFRIHDLRLRSTTLIANNTTSQLAVPWTAVLAGLSTPTIRRPEGPTPQIGVRELLSSPRSNSNPHITFTDQNGKTRSLFPSLGENLLAVAQAEGLELEGACGGLCSCSTCHVIVMDQKFYDRMPEPEEDENDMLDLANGRTRMSRLGCQVKIAKSLDGLVVRLPSTTEEDVQ